MSTFQVTPNVVITNPQVRRVARIILDTIGAILVISMAVDASTLAFDLLEVTVPTLAGFYAARTVFGFAVDTPNTPTKSDTIPVAQALVVADPPVFPASGEGEH